MEYDRDNMITIQVAPLKQIKVNMDRIKEIICIIGNIQYRFESSYIDKYVPEEDKERTIKELEQIAWSIIDLYYEYTKVIAIIPKVKIEKDKVLVEFGVPDMEEGYILEDIINYTLVNIGRISTDPDSVDVVFKLIVARLLDKDATLALNTEKGLYIYTKIKDFDIKNWITYTILSINNLLNKREQYHNDV